MRRSALICVAVLAAALVPASASADVGIDEHFGTAGIARDLLADGTRLAIADAVLVQPDDRILVAGRAFGGPPSAARRAVVVRVDAHGVLDPGFGIGGRVFLPDDFNCASCGEAEIRTLRLDHAGRVVVLGTGQAPGGESAATVVRLTPAGALDTGFGGTGIVRVGPDGGRGLGVAIDGKGRVLVAGDAGVTRLTSAGVPDATFGGGSVSLAASGGDPALVPVDLAPLPDEGVAVIGTTQEPSAGGSSSAAVRRIDAAGVPGSFTRIRPAGTPVVGGSFSPSATAVAGASRPDGTVVLTGRSTVFRDGERDDAAPNVGVMYALVPPDASPAVAIVPGTASPGHVPRRLGASPGAGAVLISSPGNVWKLALFGHTLHPDTSVGPRGVVNVPALADPADIAFDRFMGFAIAGALPTGGPDGDDLAVLRYAHYLTVPWMIATPSPSPSPSPGGDAAVGAAAMTLSARAVGAPAFALTTRTLKVKRGKVTLRLSCTGSANCKGRAVLALSGKRVIARCTLSATALGRRRTCTLTLSATARNALKKTGRVRAKLTLTTGKTSRVVAVTLRR